MRSLLPILLCLVLCLISVALGECKEGSVTYQNGKYMYQEGIAENAIAYGSYNDSIHEVGWGVLDISTKTHNRKYTAEQVMHAAGMLEGALTSLRIQQHYQNLGGFLFEGRPHDTYNKSCAFLAAQEKWMKAKIAEGNADPFWQTVGFVQSQTEGLFDGYKVTGTGDLNMCDIQLLNGIGDMIDLLHVFHRRSFSEFLQMPRERMRRFAQRSGHCSALVKVTPGFENIYMGHDSWFVYSAMLRIYKHYNLEVFGDDHPHSKLSFSSYPGFLNSLDDFYIMGSGMVMLQTTNNIYNTSLYDLVVPESLLAWHRVRVAHFLAKDGEAWGNIMKRYNSGTYNNQYMIIDLKKFNPKSGLEDGALYVVEQIPGLVESHDQTSILRDGYWASYNVPFYESIYKMSGNAAVAEHNPDSSHDLAPRAKIFRRDQNTVVDIKSMKRMMRFNNYKTDEYSEHNACNSICCRGDLLSHPMENGCYDTKVTDFFLAQNFTALAVSGPTVGGESELAPFRWASAMEHHEGMPDLYDFPFVTMKPKYF